MAETDLTLEQRFNLAVPELKVLIQRRKKSWRAVDVMEWADVSSILLESIYRQFHRYDPARPLDRWVNTVITGRIKNLVRNLIVRVSRPCVSATPYGANCSFNEGCNKCGWTKSGIQDSSCRFFAAWEKKKKAKFAVATPVSTENHIDEVYSIPSDFQDIDAAKKLIDEKIVKRLTKEEAKVYHLLYVKNLDMKKVAVRMGFKKRNENDMKGYLWVRAVSIRIREVAGQILSENALT